MEVGWGWRVFSSVIFLCCLFCLCCGVFVLILIIMIIIAYYYDYDYYCSCSCSLSLLLFFYVIIIIIVVVAVVRNMTNCILCCFVLLPCFLFYVNFMQFYLTLSLLMPKRTLL